MLKIGVSACFFHADPKRAIFKGKTLLYLEQSLAHWIQSQGALPFLIPSVSPTSPIRLRDLVHEMDGLVLHGGADVAPQSYGETPLKPEWAGDFIRDSYEIELLKEFMAQKKPVLGICRGAQLLNVAFGGTLYQDVQTQVPGAKVHRDWEIYDQNFHSVRFLSQSKLQQVYSGMHTAKVNSIHHQAICRLGKNLIAEAISEEDQLIEAIRLDSDLFVSAVQWHPEFQTSNNPALLESAPLLENFLKAVRSKKEKEYR